MTSPQTLRLVLADRDPVAAARLRYAFAAYAALHGFRVVPAGAADVVVAHGRVDETADVVLAAAPGPRDPDRPAPAPVWVDGLPCFRPTPSGEPDVLAEVFEWLAAPHERACTDLDAVGRVPPRHGLAGTHGLDLTVPWANRWLARLHAAVRAVRPRLPAAPASPFGPGATFVASHDLDHLSVDKRANARRVVKDAGVALLADRDPRTTVQIGLTAVARAARRLPTADGVRELRAGEAARGVRASYTVVAESTHRRDPGYRLDDDYVRRTLDGLAADGHELATHGSYRSLEVPGQLAREFTALAAAGHPSRGGRQHWLRHRGSELFTALAAAGARWDSTAGYPDDLGYRHGAAFPFPPWDFAAEAPHPLIEIPLVVMDRAVCRVTDDPRRWGQVALDALAVPAEHSWGGVAVLWHDSVFTGTAAPARLADAYWAVLDAGDRWVTAAEVSDAAHGRWAAAMPAIASAMPSA